MPPPSHTARDWFEIGETSRRAGNLAGALDAFRNSLRANPAVVAPWIGLSRVLDANSQFEEARQCLMRAVAVAPGDETARLLLATAHKNLGHTDAAETEYRNVLSAHPHSAAGHFGLGQLQEDLGAPEAAAASYRSALSIEPHNREALACLLGLGAQVDIEDEQADAARLLQSDIHDRDKALLGYGLGKAYDRQKQYDAAFHAFETANAARQRQAGTFDRKAFDERIERLIDLFSEDFFHARRRWGNASSQPVFVVGLPRSGTTLTEQIISSHSSGFGAGELNVLTDLATGTPDRLGKPDPAWPDCVMHLNEHHIAELSADYLQQSRSRAPDTARRVIDKQPLNFWHLGLVALALPNARIIHCRRDIRDCGLSIFAHNFNLQQTWSTSLEDIAHYWRGYRHLMAHWKAVTQLNILTVDYEDTVSDLETQARRITDFLDLGWEAQLLQFHENERAVQTPSRWQVRQPVYRSAMAKWRHYESHLGPLTAAFEAQS